MKDPTKAGAKPKKDPKERRFTRSLPLNDYELEALRRLVTVAKEKSPGSLIVKKFGLPSTAAAAEKFNAKHPI